MWFGGCALLLPVAVLHPGKTWIAIVCAFTIYPALLGWLFFNGCGILLKTFSRPQRRDVAKAGSVWLIVGPLLMVGVTFAAGSLWLLFALLRAWVAG
jgi:hypothetical protein